MENEEKEMRKFGEEAYKAIESLFDEDELAQQDEDMRLDEARMRMPFDQDKVSLNFGRRRATDLKGNARVFLPKRVKNFETEANLEMLRVELLAIFRQFMEQKCNKKGEQKSNLTRPQLKGLVSLKTRIKNGEIVVVPTDKTCNFTVMSRESYLKAGLEHVRGDKVTNWKSIKEAQREVNGHVSMLLKIFKVGEYW